MSMRTLDEMLTVNGAVNYITPTMSMRTLDEMLTVKGCCKPMASNIAQSRRVGLTPGWVLQ